jgi:hypothetical protein
MIIMASQESQFDPEKVLTFEELEAELASSEPLLETNNAPVLTRSEIIALIREGKGEKFENEMRKCTEHITREDIVSAEEEARLIS